MSAPAVTAAEPAGAQRWKVRGRRMLADRVATIAVYLAFFVAVTPLVLVLWYTVGRGLKRFSYDFLTHSMANVGPLDTFGGIYHAILGTVEQVLLASVISVPLGLLVAIYLSEYGGRGVATIVRLLVDVMTGIPSIVAGLFIFAFWVLGLHQGFSGFAGSMALAVLMLPVVIRASEEMLRLVPNHLREAALALGIPKRKVITRIVIPTAKTGITTGVMLAVARVTGETAPLLMTVFGAQFINGDPFHGAQSGLPLFIFQQASSAYRSNIDRAWAAAFTLILIVVLLYVIARLLTRRDPLSRR